MPCCFSLGEAGLSWEMDIKKKLFLHTRKWKVTSKVSLCAGHWHTQISRGERSGFMTRHVDMHYV